MNESLRAACGQFEQLLLGQMLRTAELTGHSQTCDDDSETPASGDRGAFEQLLAQALSMALERAGGIGLAHSLAAAFGRRTP